MTFMNATEKGGLVMLVQGVAVDARVLSSGGAFRPEGRSADICAAPGDGWARPRRDPTGVGCDALPAPAALQVNVRHPGTRRVTWDLDPAGNHSGLAEEPSLDCFEDNRFLRERSVPQIGKIGR